MNVRIRMEVEVEGVDVAEIIKVVETVDGLTLGERVGPIKQRTGGALLDKGFTAVGES